MFTKNVVKKGLATAALCAALSSAAVAFPATASASPAAPAGQAAAAAGSPVGGNVNLDVQIDPLAIANKIESSIKTSENRPGFVNNLKEAAFHAAGGKYNVVVQNLSTEYNADNLEGVKM
ncbi:hypothetical protein [Streptomyces sp. NPDC048516]|uniref:hypothetical protein n=1 Tax=Streptomyces sp. NPDC048516 TaxID=3365565 RepID=UPI00371EF571